MLDPNNLLSYAVWLGLPESTRLKIAALLNIQRRGIRQVMDSRIISDGFLHTDLAVISRDKMQEILGTKEDDFYKLFDGIVAKVNEAPKEEAPNAHVQQKEPAEVESRPAKKAGRPRKGGK